MKKWETLRGFSLLELVVTLSVLVGVFLAVIPSFIRVIETGEMKRLATEIKGFISYAKSQAVQNNQTLYAHLTFLKDIDYTKSDWVITLTDSDIVGMGKTISVLSGSSFENVTVRHSYTSDQISFDGVRGRAKSGSFHFFPSGNSSKKLELRTSNPPGRVKICGSQKALYGYKMC